jgi:cell wall-associated NlpC family hydrolase
MRVDGEQIVAAARAWLGVPWRHQGRTCQGIDCAGLVVLVGRALEICDYDTTAYSRRPEGQGFVQHFRACMDPVPLLEAVVGDILVFADAAYSAIAAFSP